MRWERSTTASWKPAGRTARREPSQVPPRCYVRRIYGDMRRRAVNAAVGRDDRAQLLPVRPTSGSVREIERKAGDTS